MLENFFTECYKYGYWRIFKSNDFLFSLLILIISLFLKCFFNITLEIDYIFIISILIWIFAFISTALAIIVSFIDKNFLNLIKWTNIYRNLIFSYFYWVTIILSSIFLISILLFLNIKWCLIYLVFFLFTYSFFLTYEILKTTINLWLYKEKLLNKNN